MPGSGCRWTRLSSVYRESHLPDAAWASMWYYICLMNRIYFDHASTTPVDPRVLEAMRPYFSRIFGNPSSVLIEEGAEPQKAVDEARLKVARLLNAETDEIIFTARRPNRTIWP